MTEAQFIELIQGGAFEFMMGLLHQADLDDWARDAVREIGETLKADGDWRGALKRSGDWDALAVQIERVRKADSEPWWFVMDWADGQDVREDVEEFFKGD